MKPRVWKEQPDRGALPQGLSSPCSTREQQPLHSQACTQARNQLQPTLSAFSQEITPAIDMTPG